MVDKETGHVTSFSGRIGNGVHPVAFRNIEAVLFVCS